MAREQETGFWGRFLDVVGITNQEKKKAKKEPMHRQHDEALEDEFADYEERNYPRKGRTRINLEEDAGNFSEDQGWSNSRPSTRSASPRSSAYTQRTVNASQGAPRSASSGNRSGAYAANGRTSARPSYDRSTQRPASRESYHADNKRGGSYNRPGDYRHTPHEGYSDKYRATTSIMTIHSVNECKEVILALIDKKSVLLNLSELDSVQAQRALDTMSGASYAINASLRRVSDRTWLIAPSNVEIEGADTAGSRY